MFKTHQGVVEEEAALVRQLEKLVRDTLDEDRSVPVPWLVALSTYMTLNTLSRAERLLEQQWPEPVMALLALQIIEPTAEHLYQENIPCLTTLDDNTSSLVRKQYEENPYPRWIKAAPVAKQRSIDQVIKALHPGSSFRPLHVPNPDILVAGCGTGQHPLETARHFPTAKVLAIDLSLASLGYAIRKTQELGIENLQYAQADLTQLSSIDRQFDIIESIGVLHHLDKPVAGLQTLVSLLRPNGLLKLGLYSECARQHVAAARAYISERGYKPSVKDIRRCRQDLRTFGDQDFRKQVTNFSDFFSVSGCRDLLFHVQEHRLTIPIIAEWLQKFDLTFIGFNTSPELKAAFRRRFPDPASESDLGLWHSFEEENSTAFIEMYQFWAQRR